MKDALKDRVAGGVAWSMAEKVGTMLLQLAVSLVILRLLSRDDFGVLALLTAFSAFALVVVDSGFSQTLIRKASPSPEDYKSVFVFNVATSVVVYLLLVAAAPYVARYYDMPGFVQVAPVFFLLLPVNALCAVQTSIFIREFRFALLSKVTFAASLISGLVAILLALSGCGLWSLVAQRVLQMAVRAVLLWWLGDWRPTACYKGAALRGMAPYSLSLMSTELVSTLYMKIPQFFLGKLYPAEVLGSFDQAVKLKDQPVNSAMQAVQGVTFPALSKISGDERKFAESYRQVVMVVAYAMFPIMLGMSAVARDMFSVLLDEKWMSTVPYFEAVCLAGLFYPVAMVAFNVLKVKSGGGIIVRIEIIKKVLMTLIFALTIPHSVQAVIWGLVAIAFCEMTVNFAATTRFTQLGWGQFLRTLLPVALVSGAMYASVRLVAPAVPDNALLRLAVEIATGAVSFVLLSAVFRLEAFRETLSIIKKQVAR